MSLEYDFFCRGLTTQDKNISLKQAIMLSYQQYDENFHAGSVYGPNLVTNLFPGSLVFGVA